MAHTKRKRRSKHRGTAAGTVQSRGRTGRKPTQNERGADKRELARQQRAARLDRPPTWKSAALRALPAAAILFLTALLVLKDKVLPAVSLSVLMGLVYVPLGYYTDLFLYRRRQRKKAEARASSKR